MGQSLKKLAPGSEEKKLKEITPIIDIWYIKYFKDNPENLQEFGEFYRGVCLTVEDINQRLGYTQFKLPDIEELENSYERNHKDKTKELTKSEFQEILKEVISDSKFTGIGGAKEALLYILGVPVVGTLIKQKVMPRAIPDEFFIPGITSITVLVLAGLNKI